MRRICSLVLVLIGGCGDHSSDGDASLPDAPHVPRSLYVDDDAAPGGTGTSWTSALTFLSDALRVAGPGDVIHVAAGQYVPDRSEAAPMGTTDRTATFSLRSGITLLGGYAGLAGADPDQRDLAMYRSTLSGDLAGDDTTGQIPDNAYHVVTGTGADATAILDGFTITGGNADGPRPYPAYDQFGAGMLNADAGARPTIRSCRFEANHALGAGGAIANDHGSRPTIGDSVFVDNVAAAGAGAIYNGDSTVVSITDCVFLRNRGNSGGAIASELGATVSIARSVFEDNHAEKRNGGAIYSQFGAMLDVIDSSFRKNTAGHVGGAISTRETPSRSRIANCLFEANASIDGGGAIRAGHDSELLVVSCTFVANSTATANVVGAAGGIDVGSDMPVALRTTVVVNSIFRGNTAVGQPSQIALQGTYPAGLDVRFSDVEGGEQGVVVAAGFPLTWGTGNIDVDPIFVDAANADYRLSSGSPCIDVGSTVDIPADIVTDLAGAPRVSGTAADLGAYELQL